MQPVSTYRIQLTPEFTLDACATVVPYLARLGITHVYCSPWLQSERGSQHGYDVVDHSRVDSQLGGSAGLDKLVSACRSAGLGIVLDIVPNHMSVAHERLNAPWWSLLQHGRESPYAPWFDVDWSSGKLVLPVLGDDAQLELLEDRVRYHEHEFPLAAGTLVRHDLAATLNKQHYELVHWRERLGYRRFFDVTSLAGVRVEDPDVFQQTHALVLQQVRDGVVDGLRVDHPDGLADPEGYLKDLSHHAPGTWIVAEKILEPGEELPSWSGQGTTGYDALQKVMGLFVDPLGEKALTELWDGPTYKQVIDASKRTVLDRVLVAEVERLLDVAMPVVDVTREGLREALVEVLVAFDVYRAYLPPSGPADEVARTHVEAAVSAAQTAKPARKQEIELVGQLALAERDCPEFVTRFQQTCGPVMAKGVEDTAFYRYLRLSALCEVGGDPSVFGTSVEDFHAWCAQQQRDWPLSMTTLSTHDTKRSEDVRARLVVLSQQPSLWLDAVERWTDRLSERIDHATEQLIWQTLVGAWPLSEARAIAYLEKAVREAKQHTSWLDPDPAYEASVRAFLSSVLADADLVADLESFVKALEPAWRLNVLAQKLVQLTIPGVADTYQGSEFIDLSLVDPDNRRPVDFSRRARLLAEPDGSIDSDKLLVTASALQLRQENPSWFLDGSYEPLDAGAEALGFVRSDDVAVVVPLRGRVPTGVVSLPAGTWKDVLTGATSHGVVALDDLLSGVGVALLVRS